MVEEMKLKKTRKFGGKTSNFDSKEERSFEQKHLRAYLRGFKRFRHRYETNPQNGMRQPAWFNVKEIWE